MLKYKFGDYMKRSRCINHIQFNNNPRFSVVYGSIMNEAKNKRVSDNRVRKMLESLENSSINQYYTYPLNLIQELNTFSKKSAGMIFDYYQNTLLYYMENPGRVLEAMNRYHLNDIQKEILTESVKAIQLYDRISNNHKNIFENDNIDDVVRFAKSSKHNTRTLLENICAYLHDKRIPLYQKFNIALEEAVFLNDMYNLNLDKKDIVSTISEFYIFTENMESKQMEKMDRVLKESRVLDKEDIKNSKFIWKYPLSEDVENGINSVSYYINAYYASTEKSEELLRRVLHNIVYHTEDFDFSKHFTSGLLLLWNQYRLGTQFRVSLADLDMYMDDVLRRAQDIYLSKEVITRRFVFAIEEFIETVLIISSQDSREYIINLSDFKNKLVEYMLKFKRYACMTYSDDNVNQIRRVNDTEEIYENFSPAGHEFERFKSLANTFSHSLKEGFISPDFIEESYYQFMNEEGEIDTIIAYYEFTEAEEETISDKLDEAITSINNELTFTNESRHLVSYYIMLEGIAEVHLADIRRVPLEEADIIKVREAYNHCLDYYIERFAVVEESAEALQTLSLENTIQQLKKAGLNKEELKLAKEALSYIGIDEDYSLLLQESIGGKWEPSSDETPIEIKAEAYQIFQSLLEVVKEKDDKKKNGMNFLNKVKLSLMGLKSKFKNMNQKTKEISKNLDLFGTKIVNDIKKALVSDSREQIIKGSIIPSFSKCIKFGIILAGTAFIHPIIPIILAVGGFAMSKKLTKKERLLLLDEIDVELEVLEKEIQLAESQNKIKKMRELLKYKKNLQRQYQRIEYNIRIGRDLLPDSATGTRSEEK